VSLSGYKRLLGQMGRDGVLLLGARMALTAARALSGVVVPIYLALIGYSAVRIGVLFLLAGLVSAGMSALTGLVADRIGRKPFLVGLPLLVAGAACTFAFTRSAAALYISASLGSFGRGTGTGGGTVGPYQPAASAVQAGLTPRGQRNQVFGLFSSASMAGAVIGSVLAEMAEMPGAVSGLGLGSLAAYRPTFAVMALLGIVAAALALPIREPARRAGKAPPGAWGLRGGGRRLSAPSRSVVWRLLITKGLVGTSAGLFAPFLSYWLHRRFGAGPGAVGVLFAAVNVASVGSVLCAAPLARRIGTVPAIVATRAAGALLLLPMAVAPGFALVGAIYFVRQAVTRMGMPLRQSFIMTITDPDERASVAGLSGLGSQVTMAVSPVFAGELFQAVSLALPFELAGLLQLVNAALYYAFFRRREPPGTQRSGHPAAEGPERSVRGHAA
jgi:MFS family permease